MELNVTIKVSGSHEKWQAHGMRERPSVVLRNLSNLKSSARRLPLPHFFATFVTKEYLLLARRSPDNPPDESTRDGIQGDRASSTTLLFVDPSCRSIRSWERETGSGI